MPNCTLCGKHLGVGEGHYAGGLLVCSTCGASGTLDDKPCQRCGILLPSHELQMWNSRLFCNYCIMDIRDEEAMHRKHKKEEEHKAAHEGVCEKCARSAHILYPMGGRMVCHACYEEGTGKPPPEAGSFFGKVREIFHEAIGKRAGGRGGNFDEKPKGSSGGRGEGGGGGGEKALAPRGGFYDRKMPAEKKAADQTRALLASRRKERGGKG